MRKIIQVHPQRDFHVLLEFDGDDIVSVDFRPIIRRGGLFAPLGEPEVFANVRLGDRGRSITWPGEIDFCADALWAQGNRGNLRPAVGGDAS